MVKNCKNYVDFYDVEKYSTVIGTYQLVLSKSFLNLNNKISSCLTKQIDCPVSTCIRSKDDLPLSLKNQILC